MPPFEFNTHRLVHLLSVLFLHQIGYDAFPALWHRVDRGYLEVPEHGEGQCAWDWGCGHQQQMGNVSLSGEGQSLFHTEPVLFIYYHVLKLSEDDIL